MKKKTTSRRSGSDWKHLSSAACDEIDTSEIPEISPEQFARAVIRRGLKPSSTKVQLTIRVDRDVLEWYRKEGHGYQTRINKLLRAYMEAHLKEYLARHAPDEVTEAMNRACAEVGEAKDPFVSLAARRILERSEW